ncbi:MAG: DUF6130 family protein [Candidatus Binatia bacterium]
MHNIAKSRSCGGPTRKLGPLMGLLPGPHKVLIELQDANHRTLDASLVTLVVPERNAVEKHP